MLPRQSTQNDRWGNFNYQWQSRQLGGTFNDIFATSLLYSPAAVNTTTQYRRLAVSTFNSIVCTMTSNVVELTVSGGSAPTANIVTGNINNVHCDNDSITLDAITTTGALSYAFTLNGVQQSGMPTSTALYLSVSDSSWRFYWCNCHRVLVEPVVQIRLP